MRSFVIRTGLLLAVAWLGVAFVAAPRLIDRAYHGASWEPLNQLITGQDRFGVEYYQRRWLRFAAAATAAMGAPCCLIALTESKRFRDWCDRRWPPPSGDYDVPAWKRAAIALVASIYVGACAAHTLFGIELWPASAYQMYARLRPEPVADYWVVYGVTPGGVETPLTQVEYLHPFDPFRAFGALRRLWRDEGSPDRSEKLDAVCHGWLRRYESRRKARQHDGPELGGLRVYACSWTLMPDAANAGSPDERTLMAEAFLAGGEGKEPQ